MKAYKCPECGAIHKEMFTVCPSCGWSEEPAPAPFPKYTHEPLRMSLICTTFAVISLIAGSFVARPLSSDDSFSFALAFIYALLCFAVLFGIWAICRHLSYQERSLTYQEVIIARLNELIDK